MLGLWSEIIQCINERDSKRAEIAIARLLKTELSAEDRARTMIYRARVRLISSRPDDSLADIEEAQQLSAEILEQPYTLEVLADTFLQRFEIASAGFAERSDVMQAQGYLRQIIERFPEYANLGWVKYQLGRIELVANEAMGAEMLFKESLFSPSWVKALTAYCYERLAFIAHYERRDFPMALTLIDKAIHTYPHNENRIWWIQTHLMRTRILQEIDVERAIASARYAIQQASDQGSFNKATLAEVLFASAELYVRCPGYEREAIATLQQFFQTSRKPVGVDVTWSRAYEMLGDAYLAERQFDSSLQAYRLCLQYNPYHPWEEAIRQRIADLSENKR